MKNLLLKCSILTFQWLCDCPCPSSGKPSRSELPVVALTCLNQRSVPVWQLLTYPPKRLPYLLKDCLHPNWDNSNHPYKVVLKNMNKNLCDNRSRKTRIREDQSTFPKFVQFQHYQSLYNMIRCPVEFDCKKRGLKFYRPLKNPSNFTTRRSWRPNCSLDNVETPYLSITKN